MERQQQVSDRQLAVIFFFFLLIGIYECADEIAPFLAKKAELLTKTQAGEVKFLKYSPWAESPAHLYIVIVTMEPNSLMIPHYMDSDIIIFVKTGKARIGYIQKNDLIERQLKAGDIFRVPAGSIFYFFNTCQENKLQMITTVKPFIPELSKAFFISGGVYPPSAFNGFDINTLTSAFNATPEEVGLLTSARYNGSIIFNNVDEENHIDQVTKVMKLIAEKFKKKKRLAQFDYNKMEIEEKEKKRKVVSTWKNILSYLFFREAKIGQNEVPHAYNVYDYDPDFKNDYGWSIEVNEHDYSPLKESDISIFLLNLSAGSMMAPHFNPLATEYGVVTAGEGTVEVVYPNGTTAMKVKLREGDAFWVPRFYPFCQVAAREGSMEIVGFTTSSRRNMPQFLVGKNSILRFMVGKEFAPAFGMKEGDLRHLLIKQTESVILPRRLRM